MRWLLSGLAVVLGVTAGCGDDDAGGADGGGDAAVDGGMADGGPADGDIDAGTPPPTLCDPCRRDSDCAEGALCLVLADGERGCGVPCERAADCAELGTSVECAEEVPGLPTQCRPTSGTCIDTEPGAACTTDDDCDGRYDRCVDATGLGGVCTSACGSDADCPVGMHRCRDTADGSVCVPDPLPAFDRCLALADAMGLSECDAGGGCMGDAVCATDGATSLCAEPPTGSLEDPCPEHTVLSMVGDTAVCLPDGCSCLLGAVDGSAFDEALGLVDRTRCDLHYPAELVDLIVPAISHDPYRLSFTDRIWGDWNEALPFAGEVADGLDLAEGDDPVTFALQAVAPWLDIPPTGGGTGSSDLTESLVRLIEDAGGTADRDAIATQVDGLDATLAEQLAGVVAALNDARRSREYALSRVSAEEREALFDGVSALYLGGLDRLDLRRSDHRGDLRGDVNLQALYGAAVQLAGVIETSGLRSSAPLAGDLTVETPLGRVAVRGGSSNDTYEDAEWHRTLLLVDLGGDDTYRFPAGATTGVDHGVAVVIDVAGTDDYGYDEVPDPNDEGSAGSVRLPSDADGRADPAPDAMAGPASLSRTSRQGAGRLGVGMLFDFGPEGDHYRSLRMSQGYGALGVGVLYDAGGDDVYEGEAAVQGAAGFGIGLLLDAGGGDRYVAYHASQGFAYARAVGALWDGGGDDEYFMSPHDVLYWSPQAPGEANSSLGQGMGFGRRADGLPDGTYMSGGLGVLRDVSGADHYTAGIFAQASGYWFGTGMLLDSAGNDVYDAEWYVQSGSAHFASSVFLDEGGDDVHNETAVRRNVTLGGGHDFSVAWFVDREGNDEYHAPNLSIGAGNEAGAGFFADEAGSDSYECASDFSFGNAFVRSDDDFRKAVRTLGVFVDTDGTDTYTRPTTPPPADDSTWTQSRTDGEASEQGAGVDSTGAPLGI